MTKTRPSKAGKSKPSASSKRRHKEFVARKKEIEKVNNNDNDNNDNNDNNNKIINKIKLKLFFRNIIILSR